MDALLTRLADSLSAADGLEALARPMLEMLEQVTGLESIYLTRIDEAAGRQSVL
jgi:diguanylate cyclase